MGWLCFLAVLASVSVLLACPAVLYIRYDEKIQVKVRYLFITYSLTDQKNKSVKKNAEKSAEKKKVPETKTKSATKKEKGVFSQITEEQGISGFISFLTDLAAVACNSLANLFRHCRLSRFRIFIRLAGSNPAETAKNYGEICAVLMPLSSFILSRFKHEKSPRVIVEPDFLADDTNIFADIRCKIPLFFIIREALSAVIKIVSVRTKKSFTGKY